MGELESRTLDRQRVALRQLLARLLKGVTLGHVEVWRTNGTMAAHEAQLAAEFEAQRRCIEAQTANLASAQGKIMRRARETLVSMAASGDLAVRVEIWKTQYKMAAFAERPPEVVLGALQSAVYAMVRVGAQQHAPELGSPRRRGATKGKNKAAQAQARLARRKQEQEALSLPQLEAGASAQEGQGKPAPDRRADEAAPALEESAAAEAAPALDWRACAVAVEAPGRAHFQHPLRPVLAGRVQLGFELGSVLARPVRGEHLRSTHSAHRL